MTRIQILRIVANYYWNGKGTMGEVAQELCRSKQTYTQILGILERLIADKITVEEATDQIYAILQLW